MILTSNPGDIDEIEPNAVHGNGLAADLMPNVLGATK
jgi:hypothetical protein